MRRLLLFAVFVMVIARPLNAQITVYDPANTARNAISATLKEYLLQTQQEQHAKLRRMARRLSVFADLRRFAVPDTPRWRCGIPLRIRGWALGDGPRGRFLERARLPGHGDHRDDG